MSHFIDEDALNYAKANDFQSFIQKRGEFILEKIRSKTKLGEFTEPEEDIMDENIEFEELQTEEVV